MTGNDRRGRTVGHIFTFAVRPALIRKLYPVMPGDITIAADCGLATAQALGCPADLVVGDFDSLSRGSVPGQAEVLASPVEKDDTDTFLAVKAALTRGCRLIEIAGGLGGRQDHSLANLGALQYIHEHGAEGLISAEKERVFFLSGGTRTFDFPRGSVFSVIPWGGDASGVCIKGARYPLSMAVLRTSESLGISNEALGPVEISVLNGYLMIFLNFL